MKQIGGGHLTLSWCPSTIFDIAHATGQIRHPNVDIQNPGPSASQNVPIRGGRISHKQTYLCIAFYSLIRKATNLGPPDLEPPQ